MIKKSNISRIELWRTMFRKWPFFCPRNLFQAKMFRFYAIFKNKNLHIWGIFVYKFTNLRKYARRGQLFRVIYILATISSWEQWCWSGSGNNKKTGPQNLRIDPELSNCKLKRSWSSSSPRLKLKNVEKLTWEFSGDLVS